MTDLSHDDTDDGFHEIQLSGKQLVFLFMATTVVSVVIFLCGVLVGRGVRTEGLSAAAPPMSSAGPSATTPTPPAPPPVVDVPDSAGKGLSYPRTLDSDKPAHETLTAREQVPAPGQPRPAPAVPLATKVETPTPAVETPKPAPVAAPSTPSAQPGVWAVQVVALTDPAAASAVVQRLSAKGYPAFLVKPQSGTNQNYKVQVGRFEDRSKAELVAGRLKKEEQFQPWILR